MPVLFADGAFDGSFSLKKRGSFAASRRNSGMIVRLLIRILPDNVMSKILAMEHNENPFYYIQAFVAYLHLGKLLGFSWEEIEQGYIRKNEINHQRQDNGY